MSPSPPRPHEPPRTHGHRDAAAFDYDYVIIGSGFGGSVSALRLAEKGYSVAVLEMGKRWRTEDFPKTNWSLKKYFWRPALGLHGIQQLTVLRDVFILHGAGVGGGSLVYANTLLVPPDPVFQDPSWRHLGDWKQRLLPYYAVAKRMLGVVEAPNVMAADLVLKRVADEMGRGHTFHKATVGVYFGDGPGKKASDPFFGGEGPDRVGCTHCGACMVGCRVGAKNTLDKNYLYLAEKHGAVIVPERKVVDVRPLEGGGYAITSERSTSRWKKDRQTLRARGVVFSAGVLGTVELLMRCRDSGALPNVSQKLGDFVRTNSEALLGVSATKDLANVDYSKGIAITSGVYIDDKTHVEVVRFNEGSDVMAPLSTLLTPGGPPVPRWARWLGEIAKHPVLFARSVVPFGWAKRTAILLVMQPIDNFLKLRMRKSRLDPSGSTLDSDAEGSTVPTYIPIANEFAQRMAKAIGGHAGSGTLEVLLNVATTAHILGGCPMGTSAANGVIDDGCRVFGYDDMYVVDGSMIPANLGVNPSLTITAMAEYAMSRVPASAARSAQSRAA